MKKSKLSIILANNMKYYRHINNITQEQLSEKCNLSTRYISSIENGRANIYLSKLELIAKVFDIDAYLLISPNDTVITEKVYNKRK